MISPEKNTPILTVLVYADGDVRLATKAKTPIGTPDYAWVAETLRRIAATQDAHK